MTSIYHYLCKAARYAFGKRLPYVLYFAHIPKTGGTTIDAVVRQRIDSSRQSPPQTHCIDLLRLPSHRLRHCDFISGHLWFGYHLSAIVNRPIQPFAFLREPRAILLSMYKQLCQEPRDPLRPYVERRGLDIDGFFHDPYVSGWVNNPQVSYLALKERRFDAKAIARIRAASSQEEINQIVQEALDRETKFSPAQMLASALDRLRQFWFVGLTERLGPSLDALAAKLRWRPFDAIPRLNISQDSRRLSDLSASLKRRLDELTELDRQLYDEAVRLHKDSEARRAA